MAHIFEITASPEKTVALGTDGTGEVAFTVTNISSTAVKGRAVFGPEKSTALQWLTLVGEPERLIQPKLSDTFVVKVGVPPGTKPGDYSFRLDAISVARPDEDSTQGPTVAIPVALTAPPPKSFPWWILIVVAAVIGVLGYAALKLIPNNPAPVASTDVLVPDVSLKNLTDAGALLTAQHLKLGTVDDLVVTDTSKVDLILNQTPGPLAKVALGSTVNVQIGVAIVTVPPLKGSLEDAQKAIHDAHLDVGEVTPVNEPGVLTAGQVISSVPAEGNTVKSHTKVALTVQAGTVDVPDLTGKTLTKAILLIRASNLTVGSIVGMPIDVDDTGIRPAKLSDWSPKGPKAPIGTAINLTFPNAMPTGTSAELVESFNKSLKQMINAPTKELEEGDAKITVRFGRGGRSPGTAPGR